MTTQILVLPLVTATVSTSQDGDCIFSIGFQASGVPINLSGISFSLLMRPSAASPSVVINASTAGQYLTSSGTTGVLNFDVPQTRMALVPVGSYVGDIVATGDGDTIVVGSLTFNHSVLGGCLVTSLSTQARNVASANSVGYVAGPPGPAGVQGLPGTNGTNGTNGAPGTTTVEGLSDGFTGDVATTPGTSAATIQPGAVTNAKSAPMSPLTVKSNITGAATSPADNALSAIIDAAIGATRGALLYRGASGWTILPPGTAGTLLTTNGAGADPAFAATSVEALSDGFTGDVVTTSGSRTSTIQPGAVTNAKAATMAALTVKANITGGTAAPTDSALSAIIDAAIGSTRGSLLFRGSGGWAILAPGATGTILTANGSGADPSYKAAAAVGVTTPTIQKFLSGSGTYTTPAGVTWIRIRMSGGGGGGSAGGSGGANAGGAGVASTFGTSLLNAGGGGAANAGGSPGTGGTASLGTGPIGMAWTGGGGLIGGYTSSASATGNPGSGGVNFFGGSNGTANTGAGGNGGSSGGGTSQQGGSGGGAGGALEAIIAAPSATYSYAVGAGGTAGPAATGSAGIAGGSGIIIVEEHYGS